MNGLEIIYILGATAVGVLIGMITELLIDASTIRELQDIKRKLEMENLQLRQEARHEVIEIVDNRVADDVKFGGF